MAILTGQEILTQVTLGNIKIGNFDVNRIQPNSYDVTLGNKVSYYALTDHAIRIGQINDKIPFETFGLLAIEPTENNPDCGFIRGIPYLDTKSDNYMITQTISDDGYVLLPRVLYLVETNESVWSNKFIAEISGSSSLARLGVVIHKTAGYANLGHEFKWILEVEVTHAVKVYPNMKIGQMYFHDSIGDTTLQYNGKYAGHQLDDKLCGSLNYMDDQVNGDE